MAYSADSFIAGEIPTASKWNKLWSNDASFNDGTGLTSDGIYGALDSNAITKSTTIRAQSSAGQSFTTSFGDVGNLTGSFTSENGGPLLVIVDGSYYTQTGTNAGRVKLLIGATEVPNATGHLVYTNEALSHKVYGFSDTVTGIAGGTHTVKLQAKRESGTGSINFDENDFFTVTIIELKK